MPTDALLAYVHHLAVFGIAAILAAEAALLSGPLPADRVRALARWDAAYGGFAVLALAAGFVRAVYGAKGWDFYAGNPVFWIKIGLFVVIGLISIAPTLKVARWRRSGEGAPEPERQHARRLVIVQAALFALMPLAAALMARGWGFR